MAGLPPSLPDRLLPTRGDELFDRLMLVCFLLTVVGGICAIGVGVLGGNGRAILVGAALVGAGWTIRTWMIRRGCFETALASLEGWGALAAPVAAETALGELVSLLQALDQLERSRGTPHFDPWALQAVRNDIHALVQRDPQLAGLFEHVRRAA